MDKKELIPIFIDVNDMPWHATTIEFEGKMNLVLCNPKTNERGMIVLTDDQKDFFEKEYKVGQGQVQV